MRHLHFGKLFFVVFSLLLACTVSARKPIKTLLITGQNNHNWQVSHVVLKQILENSGRFDVDFAISPEQGKDMSGFVLDFSPYQLVVLDYNGDSWPEATNRRILEYVHTHRNFLEIYKKLLKKAGTGADGSGHIWHEDAVARLEVKLYIRVDVEGEHAPVDAVGAVALGCILLGKVGRAAQHALAGSRLLTCGAIAGLIGKDGGANVGGCGVRLVTGLFQRGIHSLYFFRQSACGAGFVQSLDCLGAADIGRVLAGQGELC